MDTILMGTRWARNRPSWDATSLGDLQGVLTSEYPFIRDVDLTGELYQVSVDSAERRDLAKATGWTAELTVFQGLLDRRDGPPVQAPAPH